MKQYAFLIVIALIISACMSPSADDPQITDPLLSATETPIPTPTLHPDFLTLQESIAASSGRFSLHADGQIYDGETPLPGVTVAPDGTMTMTVDGETISLDTADVDFDDEKGITIKGYELEPETGVWVEAESEAMQTAKALVNDYIADSENVTITEEGGAVNVIDNETGKVLIRIIGNQSKFEIGFATDTIAKKSCQPTDFRSTRNGLMHAEYGPVFWEDMDKITKELNYQRIGGAYLHILLIDRDNQCWGLVYNGKDLLYRDKEGVPHRLPLIALTKKGVEAFQLTR